MKTIIRDIAMCSCCERDFDRLRLTSKKGEDGLTRVHLCPACKGGEGCKHG